ncbi:MAG: M28 family metallopeptidase [Gemmatimonadales bacterium]
MRHLVFLLFVVSLPLSAQQDIPTQYRAVADSIITAALSDSSAWNRLAEMVDQYGHRITGSAALEQSIDWIVARMRADGLDRVRTEDVMVPHWVRGAESAAMLEPVARNLPMLGLGFSVATPPDGITAQVLVVGSFDDLTARAAEARGKIVLFNVPFTTYGQTVRYRTGGAVAAARVGAVASLIRSVTPYSQQTPHTGTSRYVDSVPRIPHAAITVEDAEWMQRAQDRGQRLVVRLVMSAQTLPDARSRNVMGEITGRERPNEVVVLGGHIDSWDVGQGAMDDGGGVFVSWEALRVLQRLGLRPRRTIRAVGWTSEENAGPGGAVYRDNHAHETHVLAMESDGGVFAPLGFGFTGSDDAFATVQAIGTLLEGIGAGTIRRGGGGADIAPLMATGVPGMGLTVDGTRYFWYHHTDSDTMDKLDPEEMAQCVAAMAVMAYIVAELEHPLPR